MLGLGFALTNFGTKGGVVDTPDLSGSSAAALLAACELPLRLFVPAKRPIELHPVLAG